MSITERLANLTIPQVLIIVAVLAALRLLLPKLKMPWAKSTAEIAESLAVAMALVFLLIRPFLVQAFFIPSASMHPTLLEDDHILVNKLVYRIGEPKRGDIVVFRAPYWADPVVKHEAEVDASIKGLQGAERDKYIADYGTAREKDFIKRVIAVPGDCVRITPGYVLIDNVQHNRGDIGNMLSSYRQPNGSGTIRLYKDKIVVDGTRSVSKQEIKATLDKPDAKIEIHPGTVYINGKALAEPYLAEDPDYPYPIASGDRATPDIGDIVTVKGEECVKIPPGKLLVMGDNRNDSNDARFWGLLDRKRVLGKAMFIFWPLNRIRIVH